MNEVYPSDSPLLDLLRRQDSMSVSELATALDVTATAVRHRLTRLLAQGDICRSAVKAGRGRPSHRYELTESGRRRTGANFADLAVALWQEVREIEDPTLRRGLLERVSRRLATMYADQVKGVTIEEKMESVKALFAERNLPFEVDRSAELPVLKALACPYPEIADQDRGICTMERILLGTLLGEKLTLETCRLDGGTCCTFEPSIN